MAVTAPRQPLEIQKSLNLLFRGELIVVFMLWLCCRSLVTASSYPLFVVYTLLLLLFLMSCPLSFVNSF